MRLGDAAATVEAGARLAGALRTSDVVTLSGDLGAGKTTFARGLLEALGLDGEAPSPSYALVLPYNAPPLRLPVWHVDLYRLDGPEALPELGLDDVLSDGVLLVEWPERAGGAWPDALAIHIAVDEANARVLTAQVPPSWTQRWPLR